MTLTCTLSGGGAAPSFVNLFGTLTTLNIHPTAGDAGTYYLDLTLADSHGNSAIYSITVIINAPPANNPPAFATVPLPDISVIAGIPKVVTLPMATDPES